MTDDVYQPDRGHVATVKWLGLMSCLAVAFSLYPLFAQAQFNPATAPLWARLLLLVAALQAIYVAWMLNAPDWASVWVVMLVFACASAGYAVATAIALATPVYELDFLQMGDLRYPARAWCGAVTAVMSLLTYLCGRTSTRWHRTFELARAGRARSRRQGT